LIGFLAIKTVCVGQQKNDTICLNTKTVANLILKKEQAKIFEQQNIQLKTDIESLNKLIDLKNLEISQYRSKDTLNSSIIRTYENEISVMRDQRNLCETALKQNNKLIKHYKRRVFFRTLFGVAGVGIMTYFYITK
jgi:hypothetical protein